jgi:hypothetical protein
MWRISPISFGTCETSHVISNEVRNLSYLDHDRIGKISRCARDDNNKIDEGVFQVAFHARPARNMPLFHR